MDKNEAPSVIPVNIINNQDIIAEFVVPADNEKKFSRYYILNKDKQYQVVETEENEILLEVSDLNSALAHIIMLRGLTSILCVVYASELLDMIIAADLFLNHTTLVMSDTENETYQVPVIFIAPIFESDQIDEFIGQMNAMTVENQYTGIKN